MRLFGRLRSATHGLLKRPVRVVHFQCNIAHAVAMLANVIGRRIIGRHGSSQNKVRLALAHRIRSALPLAGFQSTVGDLRKTESLALEISRLPGIADPEFYVVNTLQLEWVLHQFPHTNVCRSQPFCESFLFTWKRLSPLELHQSPRDATNDSTGAKRPSSPGQRPC